VERGWKDAILSQYLLGVTEENDEEPVRIIDIPARLRTEYLPNTSPKRCTA
jgi:hypothetical protein